MSGLVSIPRATIKTWNIFDLKLDQVHQKGGGGADMNSYSVYSAGLCSVNPFGSQLHYAEELKMNQINYLNVNICR